MALALRLGAPLAQALSLKIISGGSNKMNTYPNQKVITTHRENALTGDKQYLAISCETLSAAARNLNGNAFKLYLYLACNKDNYQKAFSPKDFSALYKVSTGRARTSLQELIDKGYLVDNGKNHFDFYEVPQTKHNFTKMVEKREFVDDNGTVVTLTLKELKEELRGSLEPEQILEFWNNAEIAYTEVE